MHDVVPDPGAAADEEGAPAAGPTAVEGRGDGLAAGLVEEVVEPACWTAADS
nr:MULTISPECIES: hypothetical protein [Arsenicicoccus]